MKSCTGLATVFGLSLGSCDSPTPTVGVKPPPAGEAIDRFSYDDTGLRISAQVFDDTSITRGNPPELVVSMQLTNSGTHPCYAFRVFTEHTEYPNGANPPYYYNNLVLANVDSIPVGGSVTIIRKLSDGLSAQFHSPSLPPCFLQDLPGLMSIQIETDHLPGAFLSGHEQGGNLEWKAAGYAGGSKSQLTYQ
jgi:hypothetical protein